MPSRLERIVLLAQYGRRTSLVLPELSTWTENYSIIVAQLATQFNPFGLPHNYDSVLNSLLPFGKTVGGTDLGDIFFTAFERTIHGSSSSDRVVQYQQTDNIGWKLIPELFYPYQNVSNAASIIFETKSEEWAKGVGLITE